MPPNNFPSGYGSFQDGSNTGGGGSTNPDDVGKYYPIDRADTTEDTAPTLAEVATPVKHDTAMIVLDSKIVEYWKYDTSWTKEVSYPLDGFSEFFAYSNDYAPLVGDLVHNSIMLTDTSLGSVQINLPLAPTGTRITIKRFVGNFECTVVSTASIDGAGTIFLDQNNGTITVVSNGVTWFIESSHYVEVQAPTPSQIPLLGGWTNFGSGFADAGAYRDSSGRVHLTGLIGGGNTALGTSIGKLPARFSPKFKTMQYAYSHLATMARIDITLDGNMTLQDISPAPFYISLEGISFL
jgi:hypothetical protein